VVLSDNLGHPESPFLDWPMSFQTGLIRERHLRMSKREAPYLQAKIEPNKLREAVQKVFAYKSPSSPASKQQKPSPAVKHRRTAEQPEDAPTC